MSQKVIMQCDVCGGIINLDSKQIQISEVSYATAYIMVGDFTYL